MNIGMSIASRTLNIENIIIQNTILKHKKGNQKISRKKYRRSKQCIRYRTYLRFVIEGDLAATLVSSTSDNPVPST